MTDIAAKMLESHQALVARKKAIDMRKKIQTRVIMKKMRRRRRRRRRKELMN
jgi:hypothetical protein